MGTWNPEPTDRSWVSQAKIPSQEAPKDHECHHPQFPAGTIAMRTDRKPGSQSKANPH